MLNHIHSKNPNATILCTGGMMDDVKQMKTEIQNAVDKIAAENPDAKIFLEYLSSCKDANADTDRHPAIEGQAQGAGELIPIIKRIMNID